MGALVFIAPVQDQDYFNISIFGCQGRFNIFQRKFWCLMLASEIVAVIEAELAKKHIKKQTFYDTCGVSAAMMSNWRHNKNYPLLDTLRKINDFLGTSFVLTANKENPPPQAGDGLSDVQRALISAIPQLPDEVVSLLLSGAKDWLNNHKSQDGPSQSG